MSLFEERVAAVETAIGYQFSEPELLVTALTHSSFAAENNVESYERLEFLGDAVIELAVTATIHDMLPHAPEGRMTRVRAAIVDESTLASAARLIGLGDAVRLGVGEDRSGGRARSSILSDVLEAILGAVYLDGGSEGALTVVSRVLGETVQDRIAATRVADDRSTLQERLARSGKVVSFVYERSGPDHAAVYAATAYVDGAVVSRGIGGSKKGAAIAAATEALKAGI